MSKASLILLVAFIVVSLTAIAGVAPNQENAKPEPQPAAVEYKVVSFGVGDVKSEEQQTRRMDKLASEGWTYAFHVTESSRDLGNGRIVTEAFIAFERPRR